MNCCVVSIFSLQLLQINFVQILIIVQLSLTAVVGHLPYLHTVICLQRADGWTGGATCAGVDPGEVFDVAAVKLVWEDHFGWAVVVVTTTLFGAGVALVPDVDFVVVGA